MFVKALVYVALIAVGVAGLVLEIAINRSRLTEKEGKKLSDENAGLRDSLSYTESLRQAYVERLNPLYMRNEDLQKELDACKGKKK